MTVATSETDGFKRYLRSAKLHNINGKVLGMGEVWKGGDDMANSPGGGHKVNLLKAEMETYKDREDLIIMFTDSYDVVLLAEPETILAEFYKMKANVVFGAEPFCWPDSSLKDSYPAIEAGKRFLNSGGFIGYAKDIYDVVTHHEIQNHEDDQLYYTKLYLDENFRKQHKFKLDHKSVIFQNMNGATSEVELVFDEVHPKVFNTMYDIQPLVLHGNGPSKRVLNTLTNYVPKAWNTDDQCTSCWEDTFDFEDFTEIPHIVLAIFIEKPTPFIEEFFTKIGQLDYDKDKITLFIHNYEEYHEDDVETFLEEFKSKYRAVEIIHAKEGVKEWHARNKGITKCRQLKCDYYFSVDSDAFIDNTLTLKLLIEQNRDVIAPFLIRPYKAWSNFWGALTSEGYYARSPDYMAIVQAERVGVWNVPFIYGAYLIKGDLITHKDEEKRPNFIHKLLDADMSFCANLREADVFFYVTNRANFGHLVDADNFNTEHLNNELWEISRNRWDWEQRYIHVNYSQGLEENAILTQPCPDVYWFPIVTERFADELVAEVEHNGKWSDGSNKDSRLNGGYENVPTRDIHMNQIFWEKEWLLFLQNYVRPLQEKAFTGYFHDPPRAIMNFMVRYKPDEQPSLRPHHDSSTYTINIAMNHAGTDFEGGGCKFIRYDCAVTSTKKGWMLMHPGRLTHYHEGLKTTKGTRYIMISFIDP